MCDRARSYVSVLHVRQAATKLVASPGGSILLQPFFMEFAAELLPARDLARVCATSSQCRGHSAALANAALDAQHGLTLRKNATFADMHSLDGVPDTLSIDLREHGSRLVRMGSLLSTTYVGSY